MRHSLRLILAAATAAAATAVPAAHAAADQATCGGQGLPNCPAVTYVNPEYFLPQTPAAVTLQGTDLDGVTAVHIVPGDLAAPSRHPAHDVVEVDLPGLDVGDYYFQLYLANGPAPLADGGGIVVNATGAPTGPQAPRPSSDPTAAPTPAPTPVPTPSPTPVATPSPAPVAAVGSGPPPRAPGPAAAAGPVRAELPAAGGNSSLWRLLIAAAIGCGAVEVAVVLQRRRRRRPSDARAATASLVPAAVGAGDPGRSSRFCASCGNGGAAMVRWRLEGGGVGLRVPLCRRCR